MDNDLSVGGRGGSDFQNLQRNKRSITLNLKSDEGLAILPTRNSQAIGGASTTIEKRHCSPLGTTEFTHRTGYIAVK